MTNPGQFRGDFFQLRDFDMKPKPLDLPGRPLPEIFQGGNSAVAQGMAGRVSDWYLANGNTPDGIAEQIAGVGASAATAGRLPGCARERVAACLRSSGV